MTLLLFPEWRDDNQHSRYPFVDSALLAADTGQMIDQDDIVDMRLNPVGFVAPFWLSRITRDAATVIVTFSDSDNHTCSAIWTVGDTNPVVEVFDAYGRPCGVLVFSDTGKLKLEGWGQGFHNFTLEATELVSVCVVPQPQTGVRGFLDPNGNLNTGDVVLVGGPGVWLSQDSGRIRIDITGDFGLFKERCGQVTPEILQVPIKTINSETPDDNNNFLLTPSDDNGNKPIFRVKYEAPNTIYILPIQS